MIDPLSFCQVMRRQTEMRRAVMISERGLTHFLNEKSGILKGLESVRTRLRKLKRSQPEDSDSYDLFRQVELRASAEALLRIKEIDIKMHFVEAMYAEYRELSPWHGAIYAAVVFSQWMSKGVRVLHRLEHQTQTTFRLLSLFASPQLSLAPPEPLRPALRRVSQRNTVYGG
ncbi:MAG: uncharacterized protein KVP18_003719 [Porospora cf. gigantea A]|uniref:uncharacterized protein n=1 Tax=Porospora cf. gigantea A TaxID=2853593 RepID=UPI00355960A9|nr:MAG: hypothetical protein KVP18_003719 [Porospora cf. gigantea A]